MIIIIYLLFSNKVASVMDQQKLSEKTMMEHDMSRFNPSRSILDGWLDIYSFNDILMYRLIFRIILFSFVVKSIILK